MPYPDYCEHLHQLDPTDASLDKDALLVLQEFAFGINPGESTFQLPYEFGFMTNEGNTYPTLSFDQSLSSTDFVSMTV